MNEEFEVDRSLFGNERNLHLRDVWVDEENPEFEPRSHITGRGVVMTVMAALIIVIAVLAWNVWLHIH